MRLPPYAGALSRSAKAGFAPSNGVVIAGDWSLTKTFVWQASEWHSVCPEDKTPDEFDWSWAAGFPIILLARSESRLEALFQALPPAAPVLGILVPPKPKQPKSVLFRAA